MLDVTERTNSVVSLSIRWDFVVTWPHGFGDVQNVFAQANLCSINYTIQITSYQAPCSAMHLVAPSCVDLASRRLPNFMNIRQSFNNKV